jgi:hypothetical protein
MQAGICPQINSVNFAGDCFAPAKDLIGQSADETSECPFPKEVSDFSEL